MKNIFLAILLSFALISCDSDEKEQSGIGNSQKAISVSNIILPPTGATYKFTVTTDRPWKMEILNGSIPDYITITPMHASAGTTNVTVDASLATQDINANLQFKFEDNGQPFATIPLIQKVPVLEIIYPDENTKNLNLGWDLQVKKITIRSNTDWKISSDQDYLNGVKLSKESYTYVNNSDPAEAYKVQDTDIEISPKAYNLGVDKRELSLKIVGAAGEKTLNISQEYKTLQGASSDGENYIEFAPCGDNSKKDIYINSGFEGFLITAVDDKDTKIELLNFSQNDQSDGDKQPYHYKVSCLNPYREPISGRIVLTAEVDGLEPKPQNDQLEFVINKYKLGFNDKNDEVAEKICLPYNNETSDLIKFMSSGAWELELGEDCDWLEIESTSNNLSGNGSEYGEDQSNLGVTLVTKKNLHISKKNKGSVLLKSTEEGVKLTAKLPVIQEHFQFSSTILESDEFESDETEREYTINCSEGWSIKVEDGSDWLTLIDKKGNECSELNGDGGPDSEKIVIKAKKNTSSERVGCIKIYSNTHEDLDDENQRDALGYKPIICTVTQLEYIFEVSSDDDNFSFGALPEGDKKTINVTCSSTWNITPRGDYSWIKINGADLTKKMPFSGNEKLEITVSDNTVCESRSGAFDIISEGNTKSFTIEQDAFVFDTVKESITDIDAFPENPITVTLGPSLGKWEVREILDWINVEPKSGKGGQDIVFTLDNNITEEPESGNRELTVKITSVNNEQMYKEVYFSQKAHWLIVSEDEVKIDAEPSSPTQITVNCASTWDIGESADWLEITDVSVTGFKIDADDNKTGKDRSATITVKDSHGVEKKIEVTQFAK